MLEVYLDPCTINCRKVLAGLDLMGTEYHYNYINYFTGEHKSSEYMKINPGATVKPLILPTHESGLANELPRSHLLSTATSS